MVKFERNQTEKSQKAIKSLEEQKAKGKSGTCNTPEVNSALQEMFYGKCYICERKGLESIEIEHLVPHKDDLKCLMKRELFAASEFTAFKRWLIRDHKELFPELNTYIE